MAETMTKKWSRAPFGPERVEEMERYLNKMSHEGWQCCEIVRDELRFVRGEQDAYIYRVQYFYESRDGEKKTICARSARRARRWWASTARC